MKPTVEVKVKKRAGRKLGSYVPTAKQAQFAKNLLQGLKPTDAALAAGYGRGKRKDAASMASVLVKHPTVAQFLQRYSGLPRGALTRDIISAEIGTLAYSAPTQGVLTYDHKIRALDLLLKAQGYVSTNSNSPQVQVNNVIANVEGTARHVEWGDI